MSENSEQNQDLDIKDIQNNDADWLTNILEGYGDSLSNEIMLLNITKKDLIDKNENNIEQVGYNAPYGDNDEIEGLVYFYFKKCVEWYDKNRTLLEEEAKKEAKLIIEEETEYSDNSYLVL
ncbi:uncharacterized protein METZ01_LOCUS327899, partial [marine metagenome]